jgi:hypothetical protein
MKVQILPNLDATRMPKVKERLPRITRRMPSCSRPWPQGCREYPDWRLGRLVANVAGWAEQELWDVEDRNCSRQPHPITTPAPIQRRGAEPQYTLRVTVDSTRVTFYCHPAARPRR